ncbi:MAG: 4-hydroxybenzoate 3-monooxygenase [Gammaproteobacteria bacterium]|nr:4-hydroxybenzoate 3-monooxygenase [Gammaproteobacteria bacterium]MDD9895122.1 4-hydroxybenzoate 3-monooxygenase [Gammaproteobacteria bacterium]MDD9959504.1 4-hydroxybenzoate 3-monooxygenase [Gammaproteobacteria bacterium]
MLHTQIGIIGAGPAGLLLSHLLARAGIDSIVLENRSRGYVENRVRAGVLEQGTVNLLSEVGLGERLHKEGMAHHGIEIRFNKKSHRIDFDELTDGKGITIYGQQEVVKDLIAARLKQDGKILFDVSNVSIDDPNSDAVKIKFHHADSEQELHCDYVAGCDGFHGVSRESIPGDERVEFNREYPFAWLGILVAAPPSADELVYANGPDGFALHSMRSPSITRNYIQCDPEDSIEAWSDDRIWQGLHDRLETVADWKLQEGEILEKGITPMRSYVCETMRYGRLFLAGDAAHIVPPTGAKGMNLAISDISYLSTAFIERFKTGSEKLLESYAANCLRHVWRGEHFSWYMTSLLHKFPQSSPFQERLQSAELEYLRQSTPASRSLAENYVGFNFD